MHILALKEATPETRVALTPKVVVSLSKMNLKTGIQKEAGELCGYADDDYVSAGCMVGADSDTLLSNTNILLSVNEPSHAILDALPESALIICPSDADVNSDFIKTCLDKKLSLFSMNHIPRISRAQAMDSLSSQANITGYVAVIRACAHYQRILPMMMTAAGMIQPARVLVLGAGVAGLQAIATAKRLGAVVAAFDVRAAAREQVESLGAEFIEVPSDENLEGSGGYARETSLEYQERQSKLIEDELKKANIVITTALIPGRPAPKLIKENMLLGMKKGSVIMDLAAVKGGNCEATKPASVINHHGIIIDGHENLAREVPATASDLLAQNFYQVLKLILNDKQELHINADDEIIQKALLCHDGQWQPLLQTEAQKS